MATKVCGIYEVKTKLSELIRFVGENGKVVVTDRGRKVAQITAFNETSSDLTDHLDKLYSLGQASSAKATDKLFKPIIKRAGGLKRFLDSRDK